MYRVAIVAHETVTVAHDGFTTEVGADATGSKKSPRSASDISRGFESDLIRLHSLFHARKRIEGLTNGGVIVLDFTVTPFGSGSDVRIASTTFTDLDFVNAIAHSVRNMSFGEKDVATTRVKTFTLTFEPTEFL